MVIAIVLISSLISEKTEYYVADKLLATGCKLYEDNKKVLSLGNCLLL
ncbi:hypothetical protein [Candidatus Endomicrobiellum trichonymphae]